jgi:hypothetical protein
LWVQTRIQIKQAGKWNKVQVGSHGRQRPVQDHPVTFTV